MCVDRSNVTDEDLAAFKGLIDGLNDGPLKVFLMPMYSAIAEGGGICFGVAPGESDSDTPPDTPAPGIYPPPA